MLSGNYSKCKEEENPSKNFVAARNANVILSLGCTIDANDYELLSKVWNIHRRLSVETTIAEDDDPIRELQDEILKFTRLNFNATTFADVDAEVIAVQPPPFDF